MVRQPEGLSPNANTNHEQHTNHTIKGQDVEGQLLLGRKGIYGQT